MWLRDSTAQVRHYLPVAKHDAEVADCIEGLVNRQFKCIDIDPYANAFNQEANGMCWPKYAAETLGQTASGESDDTDFETPWCAARIVVSFTRSMIQRSIGSIFSSFIAFSGVNSFN